MDSKQQTLRMTGLPSSTQVEDVKNFFLDRIIVKTAQIIESIGPISGIALSKLKQTTVSFSSHDAATKAFRLEHASRRFTSHSGDQAYISLDYDFLDITTLHSCANPKDAKNSHPDIE